jgi:hypothetical protein
MAALPVAQRVSLVVLETTLYPNCYKDFAKELKWLMPRSGDFKHRPTCTPYRLPDPAAAVVEIAAVERKRA